MLCLLRGCSRFSSNFLRFLPSQTLKKVMIGTSQFTTFIFLDLETTGLRKPVEITELCMVAVERSHIIESTKTKTIPRLIDKLTTCVRPTKEIEPFASSVTCLSNEDLEKKRGFDIEHGRIVKSFIMRQPQPVCLVAHNGDQFDFKILVSHLEDVGITLPDSVHVSDSLKAFRKQHKEEKYDTSNNTAEAGGKRKRFSCSLNNLYSTFVGGEFDNAHSAEGDALALLRLVIHKPDVLGYLESGAHKLSVKVPTCKVTLDEKDINQVQDEYLHSWKKKDSFNTKG